MVRHSQGPRVRTRKLLTRHIRAKTPINHYLREFDEGEKVLIKINSSSAAIPYPKYHGRVGTVMGKRGRSFIVHYKDGSVIKQLIVGPEHLVKA